MNNDYTLAAIGEYVRTNDVGGGSRTKIGGVPLGFPEELWPECANCSRPMDFYCQINLIDPIVVSERYERCYVFLCHGYIDRQMPDQCATFLPNVGTNAAILISGLNLKTLCKNKGVEVFDSFLCDFSQREEPIVDSCDATLPDSAFLDKSGRNDIRDSTSQVLKIGGTPVFVQDRMDLVCPVCSGKMKFFAQIGSELEDAGYGGYSLPIGDAGEIYLYKCEQECSPVSTSVFWQC